MRVADIDIALDCKCKGQPVRGVWNIRGVVSTENSNKKQEKLLHLMEA